jgi:hypothetical protein
VEGPCVLSDRKWTNVCPTYDVWGRARLQPGRYDPHEPRASAPEGPAHATEKTSAPKIELQRPTRRREQAGVFPTARMRPAEENPRPKRSLDGARLP